MNEQQLAAMKLALEKIANVNAMDYEYQAWAREALAEQPAPVQEPAPPTWELTTPATALSGGGGNGVVEVEWFKRPAPVQEPVAVVSGYYGGQCVVLPTNPARLFNSGTAFYTAPPAAQPDYAWPTIADYEKEVGFEVNDAFKAAWTMARTTNDLFKQMGETK